MPSQFVWHFGEDRAPGSAVEYMLDRNRHNFQSRLAHLAGLLVTLLNPTERKEQHNMFGCEYQEFQRPVDDLDTVGICHTITSDNRLRIWHHFNSDPTKSELICEIKLSSNRKPEKVLQEIQTLSGIKIPSVTEALCIATAA